MSVSPLVGAMMDSLESVEIQLTLEGLVFCLIKIARHHHSGKYIGLVDSECRSMGLPRDDAFITEPGHRFKHVVEFDRKRELCWREKVSAID